MAFEVDPPMPDLLFTEPVVFFFSLWVAFSWAVLYLQFGSIPLVFQTNHGFDLEQSGAVFTGKSDRQHAVVTKCWTKKPAITCV